MLEDKRIIDMVCDSFDPPASIREEVIDNSPHPLYERRILTLAKKLKIADVEDLPSSYSLISFTNLKDDFYVKSVSLTIKVCDFKNTNIVSETKIRTPGTNSPKQMPQFYLGSFHQ